MPRNPRNFREKTILYYINVFSHNFYVFSCSCFVGLTSFHSQHQYAAENDVLFHQSHPALRSHRYTNNTLSLVLSWCPLFSLCSWQNTIQFIRMFGFFLCSPLFKNTWGFLPFHFGIKILSWSFTLEKMNFIEEMWCSIANNLA